MFDVGFNTQPPEGGWLESKIFPIMNFKFQHTAARRRLELIKLSKGI